MGEVGFMFFAIKTCHVPSLERTLHWKVDKATVRMSLKSNTTDNLSVGSSGLVLKEEIVFE
jgi:hypothetical protein